MIVKERSCVARGRGYGEDGGAVMMKRRRESAGSTRALAFSRDDAANRRRNWKAKGFGRGDSSVGGMGVRRKR